MNEKIREERETCARGPRRLESVPAARVEIRRQRGHISMRTAIDYGLSIHKENRGGDFSRGTFPATRNGRRDKRDEDGPTDQRQTTLVAGSFVPGFVARARVGVAVPDVRVIGGAGQANDIAVVMHGSFAGGLLGRLRRRTRCRCFRTGDRERTRFLFRCGKGIKGKAHETEEGKQNTFRCNHNVHNKYLKIPGFDGHCRNRRVAGKLFNGGNRKFFAFRRFPPWRARRKRRLANGARGRRH
jgi:hypothetical protein